MTEQSQIHVTNNSNANLSQELTMAIPDKKRNELMDAINVAFSNIGCVPPTKPPRTKSNDGPIAWELFVARHLEARAKARAKTAIKSAEQAGILFDPDKSPRQPGTNEVIYTGEQVTVWLEVREPGTRIDTIRMAQYLREKRVSQKVIDEAVAFATVENRPAHVFRTSLLTGEANGQ